MFWTDQCRESSCLGTSCVVPGPKTVHPKEPNHFRPVALTSHLMKTMERIILRHLRPLVGTLLDPLQFAYRHWGGQGSDLPAQITVTSGEQREHCEHHVF